MSKKTQIKNLESRLNYVESIRDSLGKRAIEAEEMERWLLSVQKMLVEALIDTKNTTDSNGKPCWCSGGFSLCRTYIKNSPHSPQCMQARSALSAATKKQTDV